MVIKVATTNLKLRLKRSFFINKAGVVQIYFPHKFISESHADWLKRSARKLKNTHTNLTTTPINFIPILIKSDYSFTVNFNK